jgi:thiol-disulfide isomerase/thioredoxin
MKNSNLFFALLFFISSVKAQESIPTAEQVLKEAYGQAAKENKNVLIIFHASWCGWCHKMDTSLNDKSIKSFFDDNYIIRHLTVLESAAKKGLENPGAEDLFTKYAGSTNEGIPFWLVFDKNGKLLADSKVRPDGATIGTGGKNSGCPANEEEVAYFITVLKKTSSLKYDDLVLIAKRFRENEQH